MRTTALILLATAAMRPTERLAHRTVSSISYLGTYSAGSRVSVWRGETAAIVVSGQLVDLSTGAEVVTPTGGAVSGMSVTLNNRIGGTGSRVTATYGSRSDATPGNYQIRIHYAVEVNGFDRVDIRLFEKGNVSAVRIEEPTTALGTYPVGQTVTLVATGTGLTHAMFNPKADRIHGITLVSTVSRTSTEARFKIRIDSARVSSVGPWEFFDEAMLPSTPTTAQRLVAGYGPSGGGSDMLSISGALVPTIASVSPSTPTVGATVTLSGTNLTPRGQSARLEFARRYAPTNALTKLSIDGQLVAGTVTFPAPSDVTGVDGRLFYSADGSSPVDPVAPGGAVVPALKVKEPPVVVSMDNDGSLLHSKLLLQGSRAILGKHLFIEALACTSSKTSAFSCSTTPTLPTVTFKSSQLIIAGANYSPTATMFTPGGGTIIQGVDSLKLTVPLLIPPAGGLADTTTGTMTITTPEGSVDVPNVFYAPKPVMIGLDLDQGNGRFQLVTDQTLVREGKYRLRGNALNLVVGGTALGTTTLTINGASVTATNTFFQSENLRALTFTVPSTATSGPLAVTTRAGTTTFGTMTVVNPTAGVSIVGMQLSPTTEAGGNTITATVAVNATIPSGGSAGNLVFSSTDAAVVVPTGTVAVTANPVIVHLSTKPVASVKTASITVRNEAASAVNTSATASLTLHPPAPTALTLANGGTIAGGQSVTGTITLNADIPASANIPIALTSSDPTTATVPASVIASGSSIPFTITSSIVPSTRTVTISATSDGQTRTATLTVNPPTIATMSLTQATSVAEVPDTVTVTLTAVPPTPITATISCADAALVCPASVSLSALTTKFAVNSLAIPAARTVTISATVNGVAKSATLNLVPLGIQSLTMSPATVGAGTPASVTLQLNSPSPGLSIQYTSSNTAVATTPASQTLQVGQIAQLVSITTKSPQAQSNVVTITATLTRQTNFGTLTSTKTATLTVNP
jgi:hypothetical protein